MTSPDPVEERVWLRPGVSRARHRDGETYLVTHRAGQSLGKLDSAQQAVLERLATGPAGPAELPAAGQPLLATLRSGGWLAVTVTAQGRPLYTVLPHRRPPRASAGECPAHPVLSRFAVLRRDGDDFVLEHPDAWCRILLHDPVLLAAVGDLARPAPPPQLPRALSPQFRRDLWQASMVVAGPAAEDTELRQRQWSAPERWLHQHSRIGDHQLDLDSFAGTSWADGVFDPLPARHEPFPGPATLLHRPDLAELAAADPPLTTVLESRQTRREHDDAAAITADQLGELLFRCARNRAPVVRAGQEYLSRPYPSGGAQYELEVYPVVRRVAGLAAGMYHYDPQDHRLVHVCGPGQQVRRLLATAARCAGTAHQPQVLLVVAARFGRIMWKYEQIGYALVLKHVGVLYQVVYSVATAMGLAVCGLGSGDSDAFAAATGLDPWQESSVGELMIGSRKEGEHGRA